MNFEQDREWGALLLIIRFLDNKTNKGFEASGVDFKTKRVNVRKLNQLAASSSEKFLIKLAAHLFNSDSHLPKDGLRGLDFLYGEYYEVAMKAINKRFGENQ